MAGLLISLNWLYHYDGTTKVLKKPVSQIYNFKTELFNWIAFNGILYKWKYRPQEVINQPEKCYPVVSNTLKPHFEIAFDVPVLKNRYPKYYKILQDFYTKHLDTDTFRNIIPLSVDGFYSSVKEQYRIISPASNDLLYSHPNTGKEPKERF